MKIAPVDLLRGHSGQPPARATRDTKLLVEIERVFHAATLGRGLAGAHQV